MAGKSHSASPVLLFDSVEPWEATEQAPRGQLQLRRHSSRAGAAHRGIANNLPDRVSVQAMFPSPYQSRMHVEREVFISL